MLKDNRVYNWMRDNKPKGLTGISVPAEALGLMNGEVYKNLVCLELNGLVKMVRTPDGQHWFVPNEAKYWEFLPECYLRGVPCRYLRRINEHTMRLVAKPHDISDTLYTVDVSMGSITFTAPEKLIN